MKNYISIIIAVILVASWLLYAKRDFQVQELQDKLEKLEEYNDELYKQNEEMNTMMMNGIDVMERQIENRWLVCEYMATRADCIDQWYNIYECTEEYLFPIVDWSCDQEERNNKI